MSSPAGEWVNIGTWRGMHVLGYASADPVPVDLGDGTTTLISIPVTPESGTHIVAVAYAEGTKEDAAGAVHLSVSDGVSVYRSAVTPDIEPGGAAVASLTVPLQPPVGTGNAVITLALTTTASLWRVTTARLAVYEIRG